MTDKPIVHYRANPRGGRTLCDDAIGKRKRGKGTRIVSEVTCRYCQNRLMRMMPLAVPDTWEPADVVPFPQGART